MGAHALGAAGYAAKAAALVAEDDPGLAARHEAQRQAASMADAVARTVASLPALGADRAGPLGPGRLAGGLVGEAIRAIQQHLAERPALGTDEAEPTREAGTAPQPPR